MPGRLRRGARAREGAPAEADRLRRLRLPAHRRGRPLPRDRRRGRRAACSATWPTSPGSSPPACTRTRCRTATSSPRRRTRRSPGPRSGFVLCREEHAQALDRAVFPGMQGGPLEHTIAAKATCFEIAGDATRSATTRRRSARTPTRSPTSSRRAGSTSSPAAPTRTCSRSTCARPSGRARTPRSGSHEVDDHRQPQHGPVRRAAADRRVGRPHRHAGAARCAASTRTTSARSARIIVDALADGRRPRRRCAARGAALCEQRPLYPGFRGYTTYVA